MTQPTPPVGPQWVRYIGSEVSLIVVGVGEWLAGEVRHVEEFLAKGLLRRADFAEAAPPEPDVPVAEVPLVEEPPKTRKPRAVDTPSDAS